MTKSMFQLLKNSKQYNCLEKVSAHGFEGKLNDYLKEKDGVDKCYNIVRLLKLQAKLSQINRDYIIRGYSITAKDATVPKQSTLRWIRSVMDEYNQLLNIQTAVNDVTEMQKKVFSALTNLGMVRPQENDNNLWLHDFILFSQWFGYKVNGELKSLYDIMRLKPKLILLRFTGNVGKKIVKCLKADNKITSSVITADFKDDDNLTSVVPIESLTILKNPGF